MERNELLAYLAGLVDGEGSIMIKKSTYRMRSQKWRDMKQPQYFPRVTMKNINKDVIMLMKQTFGGSVWQDKRVYASKEGFKPNHKLWCYDAHDRQAFDIIRSLYPYLIIKKPQAEAILELEKVKEEARKSPRKKDETGFHGKPYQDKFIERFEELYQKIRRLNRGELTNQ